MTDLQKTLSLLCSPVVESCPNRMFQTEQETFAFLQDPLTSKESSRVAKEKGDSVCDGSCFNLGEEGIFSVLSRYQNLKQPTSFLLSFSVAYATQVGEEITVTGDNELLGNWDPFSGFCLEWTPGHIWRGSIMLAEGTLTDFQFKYTCVTSSAVRWEAGANRCFNPSKGIRTGNTLLYTIAEPWQDR